MDDLGQTETMGAHRLDPNGGKRRARDSLLVAAFAKPLEGAPEDGIKRQHSVIRRVRWERDVYARERLSGTRERLTLGVESNIALFGGKPDSATLMPQAHWQISRSVRIQLGAGGVHTGGRILPQIASRIILED